jgi:hypothetical protein
MGDSKIQRFKDSKIQEVERPGNCEVQIIILDSRFLIIIIMARGTDNCNPGNIRHNKDKFQGEVVPGRDRAFKQFESMAFGYRAMFTMLGTYLARGRDTIEKIVRDWAPPSENDTEKYISAVEKWSGVHRHKLLTSRSGDDYIQIVAAMSRMENGVPAVMADVEAGFGLQTKISR